MKLPPFGLEATPHRPEERSAFVIGTRIFLRALAVIHAIAFGSFASQWSGLLGPKGLLPAGSYLGAVAEQLGSSAYFDLPTLSWIFGTTWFPPLLCAAGIAAAVLLWVGYAPALCLLVLWSGYLSLVAIGQIFFGFQWDSLLLEATLLAIPLAPWVLRPDWKTFDPPRMARGLIWWLLARLMFLSGGVKLASGDPTWRDLSALTFHFETQPLPTPFSWYVHQLPAGVLTALCAMMFLVELAAPLCLFGPRRLRHHAAGWLIALQIAIALTGNYTFLNLLTIALCLLCFDDPAWRKIIRVSSVPPLPPLRPNRLPLRVLFTAVLVVTSVDGLVSLGVRAAAEMNSWFGVLAPLRSLNSYGLFAVMTHPRYELIFEGSDNDREWREYEFPHKPGNLARRPDFIAPFQPRLDWHLWFAALDLRERNPWVDDLCAHLLRGTPEVLSLLGKNPFPEHPPRYIRVLRYEYHFTNALERRQSGNWWKRKWVDVYVPSSSLP